MRELYGREKKVNGIYSCDAAVIMGVNKRRSTDDLYAEKCSHDMSMNKKIAEKEYWNSTLEEIVAREFTLRTGMKVRKGNGHAIDKANDFMIGDTERRVVGEQAILLCRIVDTSKFKMDKEKINPEYFYEAQHNMAVKNMGKCYVAILADNRHYIIHEVLRDDYIISVMVEAERNFWDKVKAKSTLGKDK